MLAEVRELCGFDPLVRIQRTSINRPDIALEIRFTQYAVDSFRDLDFLVEPVKAAVERTAEEHCNSLARDALKGGDIGKARAIISQYAGQEIKQAGSESRACCRMIPKSVVYIDSITMVEKAAQVLIKKLIQVGCSKTSASDAIQAYHSELAEFDKRSISAEFAHFGRIVQDGCMMMSRLSETAARCRIATPEGFSNARGCLEGVTHKPKLVPLAMATNKSVPFPSSFSRLVFPSIILPTFSFSLPGLPISPVSV